MAVVPWYSVLTRLACAPSSGQLVHAGHEPAHAETVMQIASIDSTIRRFTGFSLPKGYGSTESAQRHRSAETRRRASTRNAVRRTTKARCVAKGMWRLKPPPPEDCGANGLDQLTKNSVRAWRSMRSWTLAQTLVWLLGLRSRTSTDALGRRGE